MSNINHFSAMKNKAGELILRLLLASPGNKIGYQRLYRELSEAGLTNTVLEGEDRRMALNYAEELGFSVNRIYPNPILAGQVILTEAAKKKYL